MQGNRVVALAQSVPGPAAARLQDFGASVTEVEPPNGDPLAPANPAWYGTPAAGQEVIFTWPLRYGIAKPGVPLGGGFPGYSLYKTRNGWISVAALEQHPWERLVLGLGLEDATREDLDEAFV